MSAAGNLRETVTFAKREESNPDAPDDYGNTVADWVDRFETSAQFVHLRAGETIMAGRLQGRHSQIVRVRAYPETLEVTSDWQVRDETSGVTLQIRDVTRTPDRKWVDLLCEGGVA